MAKPGSVGTDAAEVSHRPGLPRHIGLEGGLSGWQLRTQQKGGMDIAYGWKGKYLYVNRYVRRLTKMVSIRGKSSCCPLPADSLAARQGSLVPRDPFGASGLDFAATTQLGKGQPTKTGYPFGSSAIPYNRRLRTPQVRLVTTS